MGVTIAVTRIACNVGGGNQTITLSLDGQTPVAAMFFVTEAIADGTPASHAVIGIGAATSTSERWALCSTAEDAQATTDTYRRATTDECVLILNPADGTVDGEADLSSFGADQVVIAWGNAPAVAYLLTCVAYAGSDVSAKAAISTLATQNNTVDVNTVGFEPDVVYFGTHCSAFNDTTGAPFYFSHGVALNKATDEQYCYSQASDDGAATSALYAEIRDDYAFAQVGNVSLDWAGEVGSFDAAGFSITSRLGNPGTDEVGYLALAFDGAVALEGNIITAPIATGNEAVTDPSFLPQYVHVGVTQMPAVNTHYTDSNAGSLGISTFTVSESYCNSVQDEDNQGTSDTQSLSDDTAVNLPLDSGAVGHVAALVNFHALGWTWNFSATRGTAVQWWYVAIENSSPYIPGTPSVSGPLAWTVAPSTASSFEDLGLSISYSDPLIQSPRAAYLGELRAEVGEHEHETAAVGGYLNARFTLAGDRIDANDWFEHGLARDIRVLGPYLDTKWHGFVNSISVGVGQYAATVGPLVDIANRVYVVYSQRDTTVDPPTVIPGAITTLAEDADSQGLYGIWEKQVTGGETDQAGAELVRDSWLREYKDPVADEPRVVLEAGGEVTVSVECLGYYAWLLAYPYQDTAGSGTVTCQTKVLTIVAADPNGIFSTDTTHVDYNPALAPRYENSGTTAWEVMKALVALGDANDNRWLFGVYDDGRTHYWQAPTAVAYQHRLSDPAQRIERLGGGELFAWDVEPGQWIYLPDFLTGRGQPEQAADRRRDPRFIFIESVRFRTPDTAEITGTRVGKLAQILAKQAIGGTGG